MFKRRYKNPKTLRIDTLVGAGTRVVGDVQFKGGLHVDGVIQGNVEAQPDVAATLSVSDSGSVEGSVKAVNIVLNGTVNGDIYASERVELGATAQVAGNVYYGLIEMAMGAQINGKLIHQPLESGAGRKFWSLAPSSTGHSEPVNAELGYTGVTD